MSVQPGPKTDPRGLLIHSLRAPCKLAITQKRAYGHRIRARATGVTCPDCRAGEALMVLENDLDEEPGEVSFKEYARRELPRKDWAVWNGYLEAETEP